MQKDDLLDHLICPDCGEKVVSGENRLTCPKCNRRFNVGTRVIEMLPTTVKKNFEDDAWKNLPYEGIERPAWMALLHKKDRILYFYEKILPKVDFKGRILEVGAGTSWASALIKRKDPNNLVVATDISPCALEKGLSVARLLESSVDYSITCDAESLPFSDEYFDFVLSNATIHHFLNPQKGIHEMWRVLKRGGKCCALGEVAAGVPFKAILTSRIGPAGRRAKSLKIEEKVYSLREWRQFYTSTGFGNIGVYLDKTWQHKLYDWSTASYYRFLSSVPDFFIGNFLPCNLDIYATKT